MVMSGGGRAVKAAMLILFLFTSISSADYIYDMQLDLDVFSQWFTYDSDPHFGLSTGCSGIISTYNNPSIYNYQIRNGTVTVTEVDLQNDNNPGGPVASGTFYGGATMTVSGEIWEKAGDTWMDTGFDDVLLIAVMDSTLWNMDETPSTVNKVTGQNDYTPSGTGTYEFKTGANTGLVIGDFGAVFSMVQCQPTVTDFSKTYTSMVPTILINAEVPEPASLCLMAFGTLFITCKRKRF